MPPLEFIAAGLAIAALSVWLIVDAVRKLARRRGRRGR